MIRIPENSLMIDHTLRTQFLYDLSDDPYQQENLAGCPGAADMEERRCEELFELAATHRDRERVTRRRYT